MVDLAGGQWVRQGDWLIPDCDYAADKCSSCWLGSFRRFKLPWRGWILGTMMLRCRPHQFLAAGPRVFLLK